MKKYIIYSGILVLGFILSWLLFGISLTNESEHNHSLINESEHNHSLTSEIWTCSMHPQIMQSEAGVCPICGMDLSLIHI